MHVCTTMKISIHSASRSENIRSASEYDHAEFHIISSIKLAVLCLQIYFRGSVHVCTTMKISIHDASRSENIRSTQKYYHTKFHIIPSSK